MNIKRIERLMRSEKIQGAYVPRSGARRRRWRARRRRGESLADLVKRDFQPTREPIVVLGSEADPDGEGVLHLAACWTASHARSSGGRWGRSRTPHWSPRRCGWRSPSAGLVRGSCPLRSRYSVHGSDVRLCVRAHGVHSQQPQGQPPRQRRQGVFFASLEKERLRRRTYATHEQARSSIFQYIEEFYNRAGCTHARLPHPRAGRARPPRHAHARCLTGDPSGPGGARRRAARGYAAHSPLGARSAANARQALCSLVVSMLLEGKEV